MTTFKPLHKLFAALSFVAALYLPASAQADVATIELVRVVPGKQYEFMQWMARWDEVYKEIGLAQPKWYRNIKGDKWDFVIIWPYFDREMEAKMEKVGKTRGLEVGFNWHIKYWELTTETTGTLMEGPTTPAALVKAVDDSRKP
nr:hypothetical protein [uncultured Roseateles sp.]